MDEKLKQIISEVSSQNGKEEEKAKDFIQLVVFELNSEEYGVPITDIKEIIKSGEITPIPNVPDFIKGILNLRGKISVIIDLGKRFNLIRKSSGIIDGHIIITEVNNNIFGVTVDQVTEVIQVPVSSIQPAPNLVSSKIHADYIQGVVVLEEQKTTEAVKQSTEEKTSTTSKSASRLIVLLDMPKMLEEKELLELGKEVKEVASTEVSAKNNTQ